MKKLDPVMDAVASWHADQAIHHYKSLSYIKNNRELMEAERSFNRHLRIADKIRAQ